MLAYCTMFHVSDRLAQTRGRVVFGEENTPAEDPGADRERWMRVAGRASLPQQHQYSISWSFVCWSFPCRGPSEALHTISPLLDQRSFSSGRGLSHEVCPAADVVFSHHEVRFFTHLPTDDTNETTSPMRSPL